MRNFFYDTSIFKSSKFNVPVICIGNLSTGGTGKTPHVEYLVDMLQHKFNTAVLSRGYKRKTSGYVEVTSNSTAIEVGDEPLQVKQKFSHANVFVCEDRKTGIEKILNEKKQTQVVILDDAYQHRRVTAGFNILLTPYQNLYTDDFLLPAGNLREPRSGAKRAQIIVVTKCPSALSPQQKSDVEKKLSIQTNQQLFFSSLEYTALQSLTGNTTIDLKQLKNKTILLVSAIASTQVLINFLQSCSHSVQHLKYDDHHYYNNDNLRLLKLKFNNIASPDKIIVTTEKDAVKLKTKDFFSLLENLPIFFLPVKIKFENNDDLKFKSRIEEYVGKN